MYQTKKNLFDEGQNNPHRSKIESISVCLMKLAHELIR